MVKLLLFSCLALCCSASLVAGKSLHFWHHQSTRTRSQIDYSPELISDAKDFIALIPKIVIDELVAEHMVIDSKFRKAIEFLGSSEFKQLQHRAELLPEVIDIISFLHLNETSVRTQLRPELVDNRGEQQQQIQSRNDVDAKKISYTYNQVYNGDDIALSLQESVIVVLFPEQQLRVELPRDFVGFVEELLTHLPRDRFVALINEKRKSGTVFPKFYEAVRSDQFKQLVETAMVSCLNQSQLSLPLIITRVGFAEIEERRQHYQHLGQPCHRCAAHEGNRLRGHLLGTSSLSNSLLHL